MTQVLCLNAGHTFCLIDQAVVSELKKGSVIDVDKISLFFQNFILTREKPALTTPHSIKVKRLQHEYFEKLTLTVFVLPCAFKKY